MELIQKAVSVAVVLFFIALGILVGIKIDQDTIALLGGTVIGMIVFTPVLAIGMYVFMRVLPARESERKQRALDQLRFSSDSAAYTSPPPPIYITNNYFTVMVAPGAQQGEAVIAAMLQLGVSREEARDMLDSGQINLLASGAGVGQTQPGR